MDGSTRPCAGVSLAAEPSPDVEGCPREPFPPRLSGRPAGLPSASAVAAFLLPVSLLALPSPADTEVFTPGTAGADEEHIATGVDLAAGPGSPSPWPMSCLVGSLRQVVSVLQVRQPTTGFYTRPSRRISSSGYGVCLLSRWNLRLKSDITAATGACRARIAAASSGIPVGRLPSA